MATPVYRDKPGSKLDWLILIDSTNNSFVKKVFLYVMTDIYINIKGLYLNFNSSFRTEYLKNISKVNVYQSTF